MFETAELGQVLSKEEFEGLEEELRVGLLRIQQELARAKQSVIVLLWGVDGAGKGEVLQLLHGWMDTRHLYTEAFAAPTEDERQRPPYWRYWMALPRKGRIGLFVGGWYAEAIQARLNGTINEAALEAELSHIRSFERGLADDGTLIIKLWLHLPKKAQRHRLEALEESKKTRWRVTDADWENHKRYDELQQLNARVLRSTSSGVAPWTLVEATNPRFRDAFVARQLIERVDAHLAAAPTTRASEGAPSVPGEAPGSRSILSAIDLSKQLDKKQYEKELGKLQGELSSLGRRLSRRGRSALVVFEGADAAGKGGAIRRVTHALDARQYRVTSFAAPTEEERGYHYLWRFWRHLPRGGRISIFDRSWYGRVLVERVEGFAAEEAWRRSYMEINQFEEQLTAHGVILVKFWLQISAEEQLRRFQDREAQPYKQYKITEEDYRNRAKSPQYEVAANEMIARTSTEYAPWTLVSAEDKRNGRIEVLRSLCDRLREALED